MTLKTLFKTATLLIYQYTWKDGEIVMEEHKSVWTDLWQHKHGVIYVCRLH